VREFVRELGALLIRGKNVLPIFASVRARRQKGMAYIFCGEFCRRQTTPQFFRQPEKTRTHIPGKPLEFLKPSKFHPRDCARRMASGRYPGFRIVWQLRRLLTIAKGNRNGHSAFNRRMSDASPVTVAGPLRSCTVFLGSLKHLHSKRGSMDRQARTGVKRQKEPLRDDIDTKARMAPPNISCSLCYTCRGPLFQGLSPGRR